MPEISIIIVNWNTKDLLKACLASIYKYPPSVNFDIFVVDNASSDGSPEMAQKEFPQVKLIQNKENLGFAKANNIAIRKSEGKYILLLNSDTEVLEGSVDRLYKYLMTESESGMVGPRILGPDGKLQTECGRNLPTVLGEFFNITRFIVLFPNNRLIGNYRMTYWDHNDTREVQALMGACMLLRKSMIDEIGLMDETYFMFGEDVEWCYRATTAGWKIALVHTSTIIHHSGQSTKQAHQRMRLAGIRSMYIFFKKTRGNLYALTYLVSLPLTIIISVFTKPVHRLFSLRSEVPLEK